MLSIKGINLMKTAYIVLILVILAFFPPFLGDYYASVLREVLMWVALAVSWNFFSGYTKYISLGSTAFFGIGLYVTAWLMDSPLSLLVIVPFACLVNFALALLIGLVTLRLRGIYFAIVTFSVSMVAANLILLWEAEVMRTRGTYAAVTFPPLAAYYAMLIVTIVVLLLTTLLRRSKFGLALKMIGENEEAAVHVGVNASMYKTLGFAVSAMLMGLVGGCFVTVSGYINTDIAFDSAISFYPPVMTLLGGIGTVYGPMIGSIFLALLKAYLTVTLVHDFLIVLGVILILIVMFMPNGIMGIYEKTRTKGLRGSIMEIVEKVKRTGIFRRSTKKPEKARKGQVKAPEKPP
jgi:branched-chain amino acid transport system permease protein